MATLTKTYKENDLYDTSASKSTWTTTYTGTNVTASGSTVSFSSPVIQAKYTAGNSRNAGRAEIYGGLYFGNTRLGSLIYWETNGFVSWSAGAYKTIPYKNGSASVSTSSLFTSSNATTKTVNITFKTTSIYFTSGQGVNPTRLIGSYDSDTATSIGTILTVTLNAPPTFTATATSSAPYYATYSTYTVNLTNLSAKYGGTISSAVLTVGSQTASRTTNGTLSIKLNTAGTFTPSVKVTDSRGQVTTVNLSAITVLNHQLPATTPTVISSSPYYTKYTSYRVKIEDSISYDNTSITSRQLIFGNQTTSILEDGIFEYVPITNGSFRPQVKIVDSLGAIRTYDMLDVDVSAYTPPSINIISAERTLTNGKPDDESTEAAVVAFTASWLTVLGNINRPILHIDNNVAEANVTWYKTYNPNASSAPYLTDLVSDWTTITPNDTLYGLITSTFATPNSYNFTITISDNYETSAAQTITLAQAFYTVDFLAGGHGIAFGQLSTQNGFYCNMDAHFLQGFYANSMLGFIQMFAGAGSQTITDGIATTTNLPPGWLLCDGSSLLISEYPNLAAIFWDGSQYIYGSVDSTHFNLPDLRGRFPLGAGSGYSLNNPGGSPYIQNHAHGFTQPTVNGGATTTGSGDKSHSHPLGTTNYPYVMTTSSSVVSDDQGNALSGTTYEFPRVDAKYGFGVASNTQSASISHTHSQVAHKHDVSGGTVGNVQTTSHGAMSTGDAGNMPPYIGINFIIYAGV